MTIDQIVEVTRSLPQDVVADLVDRIIAANQGRASANHEEAWSGVVHQRIDDIRSGKVEGIPGEEVSANMRKIVGR